MNTITAVGYVGQDPEFQDFGTGKTLVRFSLAVKEFGKNGQQKSFWIVCEGWGPVADRAVHITKGREVVVTGRLTVQSYDRESNGETATVQKPVIVIGSFQLCGKKPQEAEAGDAASNAQETEAKSTRRKRSAA